LSLLFAGIHNLAQNRRKQETMQETIKEQKKKINLSRNADFVGVTVVTHLPRP
jgi:hypothetical protein